MILVKTDCAGSGCFAHSPRVVESAEDYCAAPVPSGRATTHRPPSGTATSSSPAAAPSGCSARTRVVGRPSAAPLSPRPTHEYAGIQADPRARQLLEEGGVIPDASYYAALPNTQRLDRAQLRHSDPPFGIRDGIPVRVPHGMPQGRVECRQQPVGDGVLKHLRLGVDLVPLESQRRYQVGLQQPVPTHHCLCQASAPVGQGYGPVGGVFQQTRIHQAGDVLRRGRRRHPHAPGEPGNGGSFTAPLGGRPHGLEVVLGDGRAVGGGGLFCRLALVHRAHRSIATQPSQNATSTMTTIAAYMTPAIHQRPATRARTAA